MLKMSIPFLPPKSSQWRNKAPSFVLLSKRENEKMLLKHDFHTSASILRPSTPFLSSCFDLNSTFYSVERHLEEDALGTLVSGLCV